MAVAEGADLVVHKAREAAEHAAEHIHLPAGLESTLDRARGAAEHMHLPGGAAALGAQAGAAGLAAKQRAERGLASLAGLGSKLVLGTHDLFEQIRCAAVVGGWAGVRPDPPTVTASVQSLAWRAGNACG